MKYRKKPVIIDAIRWTGDNAVVLERFMHDVTVVINKHNQVEIQTLEGTMRADIGDYIIRGINGEYYPCKPDIFDKTYECVEPEVIHVLPADKIICRYCLSENVTEIGATDINEHTHQYKCNDCGKTFYEVL